MSAVKEKSKTYLQHLKVPEKLYSQFPQGRPVYYTSEGEFINLVNLAGFYFIEQIQALIGKDRTLQLITNMSNLFSRKNAALFNPYTEFSLNKSFRLQTFVVFLTAIGACKNNTGQLLSPAHIATIASGFFYIRLSIMEAEELAHIYGTYKQGTYASFINIKNRFERPVTLYPRLHLELIAEVFYLRIRIFSESGKIEAQFGNKSHHPLHLLLYRDTTAVILYPKEEASLNSKFKAFLPFLEDYIGQQLPQTSQVATQIPEQPPTRVRMKELDKYVKPHERKLVKQVSQNVGNQRSKIPPGRTCQNCGGQLRHLAELSCEHHYCKRCVYSAHKRGAFQQGKAIDCLMPGCLGNVKSQEGVERQLDLPVCSSCGSLKIELEFKFCNHKLCQYCVTGIFKTHKSDKCPFKFCGGQLVSSKIKDQLMYRCTICQKFILAPTNPRCFRSCRQPYCDACWGTVILREKDNQCKVCKADHSWVESFLEKCPEEVKREENSGETRKIDSRLFAECGYCKKEILGKLYEGKKHLRCVGERQTN